MLIRPARVSDAGQVAAVHVTAIREVCGLFYDAAQIEAWVSGKRPEIYLHAIGHLPFFVAELDGAVVGFAELDPGAGEVRAVYVRPDCGRRGIGGRLLDAVETAARAAALERLELKASLNSVPFYQAHGFVLDELTTFTLRNGGILPCASMHKVLATALPGCAT